MTVYAANLKFNRTDPKSMAQTLFNYFLAQYGDIIRCQCRSEAELAAMIAANEAYNKHEDSFGGFGGIPPWNDQQLKLKRENIEREAEEVKDSEAMIKFLRDRFLVGLLEKNES